MWIFSFWEILYFLFFYRMRKRDVGFVLKFGDRVLYVIIVGVKGEKVYEKVEVCLLFIVLNFLVFILTCINRVFYMKKMVFSI